MRLFLLFYQLLTPGGVPRRREQAFLPASETGGGAVLADQWNGWLSSTVLGVKRGS